MRKIASIILVVLFACTSLYGQRQRGIIEFKTIQDLKDTPLQPQDSDFAVVMSTDGTVKQLFNYEPFITGDEITSFALDNFAGSWISMSPETETSYFYFSIWAEESGGLSNNNRQWSWGNGAVGNINVPIPEAELFAVGFDAEFAGTSVSIEVMQNDVAVTSQLFNGADGYNLLATPIQFDEGELVGFRTDVEVGAYTDARVIAWFRVPFQGLKGEKGDAGSLVWKGAWAAGTYNVDDVVQFGGSSYVSLATTTTQPPSSDWDLLSEKGDDGSYVLLAVLGKSAAINQNVGGANGTEVYWTWDSQDIFDSGFTHTNGNSGITVADAGNYEITFVGSGMQLGGARTTLQGIYRINGGATQRKGTIRNYSRGSGYANISAGLINIISLNAGDIIEVGTRVDDSDGTYVINTSGAEINDEEHTLIIKKL